jgi:predicted Rossmann fold nucleotide-binding protein DprA/Smf involved in DNA uptake
MPHSLKVGAQMLRAEILISEMSERELAPARSLRRETARRASNRRATARDRQRDPEASIVAFLAKHPGSTVGDLARSLNLNPADVSTHLSQLAKTGEIRRAPHGYITERAERRIRAPGPSLTLGPGWNRRRPTGEADRRRR